MTAKQHSFGNKKQKNIIRSERSNINQQVESLLKDLKQKTGEVILVPITDRTSIELPAHLSQAEREARVANYIKLHKSKV